MNSVDSISSIIMEQVQLLQHVERNLVTDILQAVEVITTALSRGNKILLAGNGGSAADAQHIAAEFVGRFRKERRSLPAIALTTDTSILTAIGNDYGFDKIFSRQIEGLAAEGDVFLAISTSGNSVNVINAVEACRKNSCKTIGLLGKDGGELKSRVDLPITVESPTTARVQEVHITIGHIICDLAEKTLFKNET